jgi:cell division protein FtsB
MTGCYFRLLVFVAALSLSAVTSALAQPAPLNDNWRFRMQKVDEGFLRLDAQTGQVSLCRSREGGWTCETVADDRAALEAEIKRLNDRVVSLERQVKEQAPPNQFRVPSDAELDQMMSFFERVMKRFRGVVENLKKEWEGEQPKKG